MKFYIDRYSKGGEIAEFKNLEECCNHLMDTEDFSGTMDFRLPRLIISRPRDYKTHCHNLPGDCSDCDYIIEVYNDWRE